MFQTKGGNSEHMEMLKRKGMSACARIANQMLLNKMSLLSLERSFRAHTVYLRYLTSYVKRIMNS